MFKIKVMILAMWCLCTVTAFAEGIRISGDLNGNVIFDTQKNASNLCKYHGYSKAISYSSKDCKSLGGSVHFSINQVERGNVVGSTIDSNIVEKLKSNGTTKMYQDQLSNGWEGVVNRRIVIHGLETCLSSVDCKN